MIKSGRHSYPEYWVEAFTERKQTIHNYLGYMPGFLTRLAKGIEYKEKYGDECFDQFNDDDARWNQLHRQMKNALEYLRDESTKYGATTVADLASQVLDLFTLETIQSAQAKFEEIKKEYRRLEWLCIDPSLPSFQHIPPSPPPSVSGTCPSLHPGV
ncbi:hypothetical protein ACFE04_011004 [Oxalis oulophora]